MIASLAIMLCSGSRASERASFIVGYDAAADYASPFVAKEDGIFDRYGLGVESRPIALNSLFPAALRSKSIDVGGPAPPEALFSPMDDVLNGKGVDAFVAADSFVARIIAAGTGAVMSYYHQDVPDGLPMVF
jgi:ABC-type nitrate/sulfonate/bicarbonate transport system substrate-binding protein